MERGAHGNLAMLCNSCSSGGCEVTYPNGTKVVVRNTPNVTDGEQGVVDGYSHCASLLRVNFGSRTIFCIPDNCTLIDCMTKDEKIKEVMELVDSYAAKVERSVASGDASVKFLMDETEAYKVIESKLRELIQ